VTPEQAPALTDSAFEEEVLRFLPDVVRFARSLAREPADADDLVQETYLRAFRGRHTFQPDAGTRQWLFTICRNVFLRSLARDKRLTQPEDDAELETLASVALHREARSGGYEDVFSRLDFGPALERAMARLPEPFRVAFALVDIGELSYAEAAEALNVPVGTVRSRLFRARRELQESLIDYARDAGLAVPHKEKAP